MQCKIGKLSWTKPSRHALAGREADPERIVDAERPPTPLDAGWWSEAGDSKETGRSWQKLTTMALKIEEISKKTWKLEPGGPTFDPKIEKMASKKASKNQCRKSIEKWWPLERQGGLPWLSQGPFWAPIFDQKSKKIAKNGKKKRIWRLLGAQRQPGGSKKSFLRGFKNRLKFWSKFNRKKEPREEQNH